jgi:glycosyltransferase involved in cell wall biosynthesis
MESWRPRLAGYTTRGWALLEAQAAAGIAQPSVLVTSRQQTYGAGGVEAPNAVIQVRQAPTSRRERLLRRVRPFYVDAAALQREVERAAQDFGAEIVHVHWSSGIGWAAARAAARLGLPFVAEVRFDLAGAVMTETVRRPVAMAERALRWRFERHLQRADAVVAASHSLGALLVRERPALRDRLFVVPNGVDAPRFAPSAPEVRAATRERLGLDGKLVVGSTSNMLRYEGLDLLLDAVGRLRDRLPGLHVLLVGDGTQRAELEAQARREGLPVTFTGRVPFDEVPALLGAMDLFAIPRRPATITRYAAPIKAVEAMAAGLPIVGAAVGDVPDLLASGRGRVVPPAAPDRLDAALLALADADRRAEMGRAARRWAEVHGTWASAVAPYRDAYARALGHPQSDHA